ncbi:hypothetical protein [Sulfurimonas sp.]
MSFKDKISNEIAKNRKRIKELSPGIITPGAGDDPAGIVTYTVIGTTTGFSQLWLFLLSTPMMIANNKNIMGEYVATRFQNIFSLFAFGVTVALTIVMI